MVARMGGKKAAVELLRAAPSADLELETVAAGDEIESLHKPMLAWCGLYGVLPIYVRPDLPTTNCTGQFDFPLLHNGFSCAVEFKTTKKLKIGVSADQKLWQERAESCGVKCLITDSFKEATTFAIEHLHITIE